MLQIHLIAQVFFILSSIMILRTNSTFTTNHPNNTMQTVIQPEDVTRTCRCGGTAVGFELTETPCFGTAARTIDVKVRCEDCGAEFEARVGRNEESNIFASGQIAYYQRRKDWAREILDQHGVTQKGGSIEVEFEGIKLRVWIGPRGGVRIDGPRPWD